MATGRRREAACPESRRSLRSPAMSSTAEWRTAHLDHGGDVLYYEVTGAPDARTVVLTHGAGGTHASWFQQVPALAAAGYRVVTWDSRGFGNSTCTDGTV